SPSTSARPSVAGDRPSRILIKVDLPAPLAPTSPVTPGPTSTESRSSAVTRGNRLLRLSVAITVTSSKVVTRTTPVVRPQSGPDVRLQTYGSLGVPLLEGYAARPGGVIHRPGSRLLTRPPTTVTFVSVKLRARTAVGVDRWGGGMTTAVTRGLSAE